MSRDPVREELETKYSQAIEDILAIDIDEAISKSLEHCSAFGLQLSPSSLGGITVALLVVAEEAQTVFPEDLSEETIRRLRMDGWRLIITRVREISYYEDFFARVETESDVTFSLDAEDAEGEWSQDWWPYRGKYKFL